MFSRLYRWFAGPPDAKCHVAGLGEFEGSARGWGATLGPEHGAIVACCGGDDTAPNAAHIARLRELLTQRGTLFAASCEYLRRLNSDTSSGLPELCEPLRPFCVVVLDRGDCDFMFEVIGVDDESIWEVWFKDGQPSAWSYTH